MALDKALLDMIALLPAEDQAGLTAMMEKNALLREGYLRQADYDRKQNELKAEKAAAADAAKNAADLIKKNQEWFANNKKTFDEVKTDRDRLFNAEAELRTKLEIAEKAVAGAGAGATDSATILSAVEERFKKAPYLTREQADEVVKQEIQKAVNETREAFTKTTMPAYIAYNLDMAQIMSKHEREFGEDFDRDAYLKFISDNQLTTLPPKDSYARFVEPRRLELREKKLVEDTEKRVRSEVGVPGAGVSKDGLAAGSVPEGGAVVEYMRANKSPVGGSMSEASSAASNELRQEGKF